MVPGRQIILDPGLFDDAEGEEFRLIAREVTLSEKLLGS